MVDSAVQIHVLTDKYSRKMGNVSTAKIMKGAKRKELNVGQIIVAKENNCLRMVHAFNVIA